MEILSKCRMHHEILKNFDDVVMQRIAMDQLKTLNYTWIQFFPHL